MDRTQYQHCSDPLNSNGKRMRVEYGTCGELTCIHFEPQSLRHTIDSSNSSPRSITTSKGPQRLTLPPGYHPPPAPVQKNVSDFGVPIHTIPFVKLFRPQPQVRVILVRLHLLGKFRTQFADDIFIYTIASPNCRVRF